MESLEPSSRARALSRLGFYALVFAVMWTTSLLLPEPGEYERELWESAGVARPYFAVPVSELDPSIGIAR